MFLTLWLYVIYGGLPCFGEKTFDICCIIKILNIKSSRDVIAGVRLSQFVVVSNVQWSTLME